MSTPALYLFSKSVREEKVRGKRYFWPKPHFVFGGSKTSKTSYSSSNNKTSNKSGSTIKCHPLVYFHKVYRNSDPS